MKTIFLFVNSAHAGVEEEEAYSNTLPRRYWADPFQAQMQNIVQHSSAQPNVRIVLERVNAIQMNRDCQSF